MTEALILAGLVAATAAVSLWWRARDGQVRAVADRFPSEELAALGAPPGHRVLVEFTAPSCPPCVAARRTLDEAAARRDGVTVRTVDVAEHLDLARHHKVLRTPTTFVLDTDGNVLGRITGVPDHDDLTALLDDAAARGSRAA